MNLVRKMMISCRKATELIEKRSLFGLTVFEKVNLVLHTSMCDACTLYEKQSKTIDKMLHTKLGSEKDVAVEENQELKDKIKAKL